MFIKLCFQVCSVERVKDSCPKGFFIGLYKGKHDQIFLSETTRTKAFTFYFFLQNPDVPMPSQVDKDFFRKVYILAFQIRFLDFFLSQLSLSC